MSLQLLLKLIEKIIMFFLFNPLYFVKLFLIFSFSFFYNINVFFDKNQFVFATRFNSILSFFFELLVQLHQNFL